jgi:hypothetical protein
VSIIPQVKSIAGSMSFIVSWITKFRSFLCVCIYIYNIKYKNKIYNLLKKESGTHWKEINSTKQKREVP